MFVCLFVYGIVLSNSKVCCVFRRPVVWWNVFLTDLCPTTNSVSSPSEWHFLLQFWRLCNIAVHCFVFIFSWTYFLSHCKRRVTFTHFLVSNIASLVCIWESGVCGRWVNVSPNKLKIATFSDLFNSIHMVSLFISVVFVFVVICLSKRQVSVSLCPWPCLCLSFSDWLSFRLSVCLLSRTFDKIWSCSKRPRKYVS